MWLKMEHNANEQQIRAIALVVLGCREAVLDALSPLGSPGSGIADGKGAIYLWARLPEGAAVSQRLECACNVVSRVSSSSTLLLRCTCSSQQHVAAMRSSFELLQITAPNEMYSFEQRTKRKKRCLT